MEVRHTKLPFFELCLGSSRQWTSWSLSYMYNATLTLVSESLYISYVVQFCTLYNVTCIVIQCYRSVAGTLHGFARAYGGWQGHLNDKDQLSRRPRE